MDALNAGIKNEPRKRKRRVSSSKDENPVAKAAVKEQPVASTDKKIEKSSPSPTSVRPVFKFYTDTMETPPKSDVDIKEMETTEDNENRSGLFYQIFNSVLTIIMFQHQRPRSKALSRSHQNQVSYLPTLPRAC